jgi:hypothetical protein
MRMIKKKDQTWVYKSLCVAANSTIGRMSSSSAQYERIELTQCFNIAESKSMIILKFRIEITQYFNIHFVVAESKSMIIL